MAADALTSPVEDSVPKVDGRVAVGEDLEFQRKWWRFETGVWIFFTLVLIADLLGLFGRGYLAKAKAAASDGSITLDYERIERAGTPSIITIKTGPSAVHNGQVRLLVSQSLIKELGAQRISPQPFVSSLADGGIVYVFPATGAGVIEIALSPSFPGRHKFSISTVDGPPIQATAYVLP